MSRKRVATFLVPPTAVALVLYQALTGLQIVVTHAETLLIIGVSLGVGVAAGLAAAFGGELTRIAVLSVTTVLLLDMTLHLTPLFDARVSPQGRDERRIADLHQIQAALEEYVQDVGPLPRPADYGEGTGPSNFWQNWWDVSSDDQNGNGLDFLDFLVEKGGLARVPVDPINQTTDPIDPQTGSQYVYFVVPPGYVYEGGTCSAARNRSVYMLAVTNLETVAQAPPERSTGSECDCLWRDQPNFFQKYFDYIVCGTF